VPRDGTESAAKLVGVEEVARVGRLVHKRLYLRGHHLNLGTPINGASVPETIMELIGVEDARQPGRLR
jgi:hypothetical protein